MEDFKKLMGFLPLVTVGMWLRGMWFWAAVCLCNPADDSPWWVFVVLVSNVAAAGYAVYTDRERWKVVMKLIDP